MNNEKFDPSIDDAKHAASGTIRSKNDYRYINIEHILGSAAAQPSYPANFSIDYSAIPDLYQRKIGACTNYAFAEIMMRRELRLKGQILPISPRFLYSLCKMEDGVPPIAGVPNQATFCNQPFKTAVKYGCATEATVQSDSTVSYDAYVFSGDVNNIPKSAFTEADGIRIPGYVQVGAFDSVSAAQLMQGIIASKDGVAICLAIGTEWYTSQYGAVVLKGQGSWNAADIIPIAKCAKELSGHVVTAFAYETEATTHRIKIFFRNHWSTAWADADTGWFYLDEHPITEAWIITEIPDPLLAIVKSLPSAADFSYSWGKPMNFGDTNQDVLNLQIALKIAGTFPFNQPVTQYFGNMTRQAVMAYQTKHNVASAESIASANGSVGPNTLKALNIMFSHK